MKFVLMLTLVLLLESIAWYAFWYSKTVKTDSKLNETAAWIAWLCFLALSAILISFAIALKAGTYENTTAKYVLNLAHPYIGTDSWEPMENAIAHLREHPLVPVYRQIFFHDHIKFQYPLSSLLLFDIPQKVSGASWPRIEHFFNLISLYCIPVVGMTSYFLLRGGTRSQERYSILDIVLMLLSVLTAFWFYPLIRSYYLGQIQTLMTCMAALALLAWQRQRKELAGVLLGICCAIKPQWLMVIAWACIRRQWGLAVACGAAFGAILFVSLLLYGPVHLVGYPEVLSYIAHHGEAYFPNQSVNGLVNRLLFNGNNLEWDGQSFAPYKFPIYLLTMTTSVVILGTAMFWRWKETPSTLDFAIAILSLTMASPVAWEHHYAILLPIFAVAAPPAIARRPWGNFTAAYLVIAFILAGQKLDELAQTTASSHWNFIQSYLFFGAIMVLLLLYRLSAREHGVACCMPSSLIVGSNSNINHAMLQKNIERGFPALSTG